MLTCDGLVMGCFSNPSHKKDVSVGSVMGVMGVMGFFKSLYAHRRARTRAHGSKSRKPITPPATHHHFVPDAFAEYPNPSPLPITAHHGGTSWV